MTPGLSLSIRMGHYIARGTTILSASQTIPKWVSLVLISLKSNCLEAALMMIW